VVSLLALVVSAGTAVLAWQALDKAGDARDIALAGGGSSGKGGAQPTAAAPGGSAPTKGAEPADPPTGGSTSSTTPPELNAATVYTEKYTSSPLTLRVPSCGEMTVDLDEPRVQVEDAKAELTLKYCGGSPYFLLSEGVDASQAGSPTVTPQECSDKIRADAIVAEEHIPVVQGLVLCVTTSFADAKSRGDVWRLIRVKVTGVGNDHSVTINADAWNIPG
jgi:hypothetical protein